MKKSTTYKGVPKPYGKSGHFHESIRHSLQAKGIKTGKVSSIPHIPEPEKKQMPNPFDYQDSHQEQVIHSGWKEGNTYRFVLEGTGDIFRELTNKHPHWTYIEEKIKRIERHISDVRDPPKWNEDDVRMFQERYGLDPKETGIHPEDSFQYAYKNNKDKFELMKQQWINQSVVSESQRIAVKLNIAMLDGDFKNAEKLLDKIKADYK